MRSASEVVVLLFELANFFFGIVAVEQFEKAFENASALFRHGGGCRRAREGITLTQDRSANRLGYGASVTLRELAGCAARGVVQTDCYFARGLTSPHGR